MEALRIAKTLFQILQSPTKQLSDCSMVTPHTLRHLLEGKILDSRQVDDSAVIGRQLAYCPLEAIEALIAPEETGLGGVAGTDILCWGRKKKE